MIETARQEECESESEDGENDGDEGGEQMASSGGMGRGRRAIFSC